MRSFLSHVTKRWKSSGSDLLHIYKLFLHRPLHRRLFIIGLSICLIIGLSATAYHFATPKLAHAALSPDQRADQLLAQMTLDEKIALVHGVAGILAMCLPIPVWESHP
jgi:hypothetical protein